MELEQCVSKMILHRESAMLVVAMDNFIIVFVDTVPKRIIREFTDNAGSICDMWVQLVDWVTVTPLCVSLTESPSGEYLATVHVASHGIWCLNVLLYPLPQAYDPLQLYLPMITMDGRYEFNQFYYFHDKFFPTFPENNEVAGEAEADDSVPEFKSQEQISNELVTLSLVSKSHWLNLLDLDIIKVHLRFRRGKVVIHQIKCSNFAMDIDLLKPVLLIYDGHGSCMTYGTVKKAMHNYTIILSLPPYIRHVLMFSH
ncbi:WD repeat-containing protein 36 [Araneus ventricosus]|uniref:WD repeat-containing protein 36 n=1 Tax=Araneus ventricosus TaxID=182803 RepID=A0A4Y2J9Z5_ARAVE|nr:WD repeat-containing protein 36 [Araneus ventricosus]